MIQYHDTLDQKDYDAKQGRKRALRGLRRVGTPLLLGLVLLTILAPRASAGYLWCRTDPALSINGQTVNIFVASTEEIFQQAVGPTIVVVSVPVGVSAELLWTDPGFGYGEVVHIVPSAQLQVTSDGVQIAVTTIVPATGSLPVLVEVVPESQGVVTASVEGTTNRQVKLVTTI